MSILGTRVVRIEDPAFLTRGAVYTEDVQDERLDGACYVFFVRSPIAHARVNSVDPERGPGGSRSDRRLRGRRPAGRTCRT